MAYTYLDSRRVSFIKSPGKDPHEILGRAIGPAYAYYRRRWDEARTFQNTPPFPLHVDYELQFKCNLRCPMCLMSLDDNTAYGDPAKSLTLAKVKELIEEGAANGQAALGFGGLWEPLISNDLPEIIAFARQKGLVDVLFNTNGLLLTEKTGRELIKAGLTKLMISLDAATPRTYEQMRPGSDLAQVTANIKNFIALRTSLKSQLPLVRLSFCRTALNENELDDFMAAWANTADFFSIQNYGRYETQNQSLFPQTPNPVIPEGLCAQPNKRLLVRHNGQVVPCCDVSGLPLVVGNIHQSSLTDIWNGEALKKIRARLLDKKHAPLPCRQCEAKFIP